MPQLTVYKASAGSGKTFRLTVEYLKLLLINPESYRHILAVTFTNKATSEMKERVLNALRTLSTLNPDARPNGLTDTLCNELKLTPQQAREKAIRALSFLLHDYGRFRIETIDSFFQSVLRNLARELGLGAWLNIELNNNQVLSDAVDALMDKADQQPDLLQWITEFIEEMLDEGKSWRIDQELKRFGEQLFKEYFKDKEAELEVQLSDKKLLKTYKNALKALEQERTNQLKQLAEPFFSLLESNGLSIDDFSYKVSGPCSYFLKLQRGEAASTIFESSRLQAALSDPEKWSSKSSKNFRQISALAAERINPLLLDAESKRPQLWKDVCSARLAVKHLNQVGLLSDLAAEVRAINDERHQFLLSDTNTLLKKLMEGSDASFIYEKIGVELRHILFDEFQDTSRMQWDTFKPLLQEGLANGFDSLIVGDEKQSIYRWRNGDWRILGNIRSEVAPLKVEEQVLSSNWRSAHNIVHFNNRLFETLEQVINGFHQKQFQLPSAELHKAYADVQQLPEHPNTGGLVSMTFVSDKDSAAYRQEVLHRLVKQLESLQRQGIRPDQTAILIRRNKEIPEIGAYIAEYKLSEEADPTLCYDLVSDEAFLLQSSSAVQMLIHALRVLNDPLNPIYLATLKLDYQTVIAPDNTALHNLFRHTTPPPQSGKQQTVYKRNLPETEQLRGWLPDEFLDRFEALQRMPIYETVEELYRIFRMDQIQLQDSYLHCFMDKLAEYLLRSPGLVSAFLEYWDSELSTTSIPAGSAVAGIRILSIHKSKGLEFHTVLLPFCDWKLQNALSLRIWCQPNQSPFDQLCLLPIDYNKNMAESIFDKEYVEETLQLWVDALNLAYVAFTRAKFNLLVWARGSNPSKEEKAPDTIGKLIQNLMAQNELLEGAEYLANDAVSGQGQTTSPGEGQKATRSGQEQTTSGSGENPVVSEFRYGTLEPGSDSASKATESKDIPLKFSSFSHKTAFRQSNRSKAFCNNPEASESEEMRSVETESTTSGYIERGNLLHRLFQDIHRKEDTDKALQTLVQEGLIRSDEVGEYRLYVQNALGNPKVSDWYSGRYKLYNECSILCTGSDGKVELKRPDRVMQDEHETIVVDFKFGKEKKSHYHQVEQYKQLLKQMGTSSVKGYLWYVDENRLTQV